jgi:hypothetical protein
MRFFDRRLPALTVLGRRAERSTPIGLNRPLRLPKPML